MVVIKLVGVSTVLNLEMGLSIKMQSDFAENNTKYLPEPHLD